MGQLRLIQGIRNALKVQPTAGIVDSASSMHILSVTDQSKGVISKETQRQLGLSDYGEKISYLKNRDYVIVLSMSRDNVDEVVELLDGSKFVLKGMSTQSKPKLDNISPLQWMEKSIKILVKMIMDGNVVLLEQVPQYAGHIAETCLLGQ